MSTKCIIFARVSTQKQTLEQQLDKLIDEARKREYDDSQLVIIKDKESATKLSIDERLGLQKLKEAINQYDDIDCIIIYELSRLSRRPADLYQIRDFLLKRKINLISLAPPMELLDSNKELSNTASMIFGIFGSLAEQEGYLRVERVKRGIAKKKSEGKVMGRKMIFGYDRINGEPVINEQQADVVREIFRRFEAGESCGVIGYDMFLRGVFGSDLKRNSTVSRVSVMLADGRYAGEWPFPAIVSKTQFDKCRDIIHQHSKDFARVHYTDKDYYCVGVLYTDRGFAMCPSYGNRRYQYRDPNKVYSLNANMNIVDNLTLYALKKYLDSGINEAEKQAEIEEVRRKIDINKEKQSEINKKIALLNEENEMIENRIIKKRITEARGDEMIDENLNMIKKLEESLDDIIYENGVFMNRLIYLNSFLYEGDGSSQIADTPNDIKANIKKYIERIVLTRLGFGRFKLRYIFKDKSEKEYGFHSVVHNLKYYDENDNEIKIEK